jgi:hypothetical protein
VTRAHPTPILSLPLDSFTAALGHLDPASRALLDLSLRRGMRPEEIGDLLGTDPESVIVAREQALEHLASDLGLENLGELDGVRARLAELPADAWTPGGPTRPKRREPVRVVVDAEPGAEPALKPRPQEKARRKSSRPLLLALLAVAAVAAILVIALSGDDEQTASNAPGPAPSDSKPAPPATPKPAPSRKLALAPVAGSAGDVEGTARLLEGGKRLRVDVKGLPDPGSGSYHVWLYDSVIDAESIGSARGTKISLDLKLPPNASHYRYVDISREPSDGNPNHSGESLLRVQLSELAR